MQIEQQVPGQIHSCLRSPDGNNHKSPHCFSSARHVGTVPSAVAAGGPGGLIYPGKERERQPPSPRGRRRLILGRVAQDGKFGSANRFFAKCKIENGEMKMGSSAVRADGLQVRISLKGVPAHGIPEQMFRSWVFPFRPSLSLFVLSCLSFFCVQSPKTLPPHLRLTRLHFCPSPALKPDGQIPCCTSPLSNITPRQSVSDAPTLSPACLPTSPPPTQTTASSSSRPW